MKGATHFFAVITLYKKAAWDSVSFQTLLRSSSHLSQSQASLHVLLYDNTPGGQSLPELPLNVRYHTSGHNDGLADAFNFALELAQYEGCEWLITLDQDTALPPHFLGRMAELAAQFEDDSSIAAIVPQIFGDGRILSPNWFWAGPIPRWFPAGFVGIPNQPTFAFNSASTLRVNTLRQIGGYSPWFWLDNCDSVLYHQLNQCGQKVFVAGDLQVNHDFSMLDKPQKMNIRRYHELLMSESAFWDLAMNRLAGVERTARLFARWCKHVLSGDPPAFRKETARALKRRLCCSREARIALWKKELQALRPSLMNAEERFPLLQQRLSAPGRLRRSPTVG